MDTELSDFLRDNEERKKTLKEILYSKFPFSFLQDKNYGTIFTFQSFVLNKHAFLEGEKVNQGLTLHDNYDNEKKNCLV